jgi:hypothetical protein
VIPRKRAVIFELDDDLRDWKVFSLGHPGDIDAEVLFLVFLCGQFPGLANTLNSGVFTVVRRVFIY